ncbi:MAG: glycosyltransferase family 1 protein [Gallionellaceae bacterium]|nr:glycosyltransferase family 1 protein [Gallionellaceae bacterium]
MISSKRLYLDCTGTYLHGWNTGIQRVVRSLLKHSHSTGRDLGIDIIPIVTVNGRYFALDNLADPAVRMHAESFLERGLRRRIHRLTRRLALASVAREYRRCRPDTPLAGPGATPGKTSALLNPVQRVAGYLPKIRRSRAITFAAGDIIFLPDYGVDLETWFLHRSAKAQGAKFIPFIHDVIPLTHQEIYGARAAREFTAWLTKMVLLADGIICNSRYCRATLLEQIARLNLPVEADAVRVGLLGHDFSPAGSIRTPHAELHRRLASDTPHFLCVGTIEPRKNLDTLLDGFEHYLARGGSGQLVLIGRKGWLCDDFLARLVHHREYGRRLHWFNDIDDENLEWAYARARAVVFPSIVEGFGLPLVEALGRGTPVIASDIEAFREIGDGYVQFFPPLDPGSLADIMLAIEAEAPPLSRRRIADFRWPSWQQSTRKILGEAVQLANSALQRKGPRPAR